MRCLFGDAPIFRGVKTGTCGPNLRAAFTLSSRFNRPRRGCGAVRVTKAGNGKSDSRALTTVLRDRNCGMKLCASPRLMSFERHVQIGKRYIPRRCIVSFIRRGHAFFRPLRPSFFRLAATVTLGCFTRRGISCTIVRIKLNKELSYAGVVAPVLSVVAGVDFSRARFLNGALTRVTNRGTKVVGPNIPMIVKRCLPRAQPMFRGGTGTRGTPVLFTRSFSMAHLRGDRAYSISVRLGNSCRRHGGGAVLTTLRVLHRGLTVDSRTVHRKFTRMYRLANLHKE